MISLGLSSADARRFEQGLVSPSHAVRQRVQILDMDHNVLAEVTGRVLSGQVDVDAGAEQVFRMSGLSILDHDGQLNLDAATPATGATYMDRMVRVHYGVWSPELPRWVHVPVFCGPITSLSRDDGVVSLGAVGKEYLMQGKACLTRTWAKGTRKTTVMRELLAHMGEQYADIPDWPDKLATPLSIAPTSIAWDFLQSLARSFGDVRLYYDARGYLKLRRHAVARRWTFRDGDGGSLVSMPKISYNASEARNFVVVQGGVPKGAKKPILAVAHAPRTHPLSALTLGRGGRPRYLREDVEATSITDPKRAQALADNTLQAALTAAVQTDFDSLVIPHLEPWDVVGVNPEAWAWEMQLTKYSIPLGHDGHMAVGRNSVTRTFKRPRKVARRGPSKRPAPHKTGTRKATR